MPPSNKTYPREVVTIEKKTPDSEEKKVATVVANEAEEAAVNAAIGYMDAFNEADPGKTDKFLNFPHARVGAEGRLVVNEKTESPNRDLFERFRKDYGWAHSCWDSRVVIQSSDIKVHLMVAFSRYKVDGTKIGTFPSIWIVTKQDGHWGIKMRSSYAR